MMKRILKPLEKVSNVELFYDLIFVYLVDVACRLLRDPVGGFFALDDFVSFSISLIVILQIWFNTTTLMNRFGDASVFDNACMFVNMFCLYFMAEGINDGWNTLFRTFSVSWAVILANLIIHWYLKLHRYKNIDEVDRAIISEAMRALTVQLVLVFISCLLPLDAARAVSVAAVLYGAFAWMMSGALDLKPTNFDHLAERCCLLVIVTFGDIVVTLSSYMRVIGVRYLYYPVLVFLLVIGLFLIYDFEYELLLDHERTSGGRRFMIMNSWVVIVLANTSVALSYMANDQVTFFPKSVYITCCLVAYLLTSFMLGIYNKPQFRLSWRYVRGRLVSCLTVVVFALASGFDPTFDLAANVVVVYASLIHEALLYTRRSKLMRLAEYRDTTCEELMAEGYYCHDHYGRAKIEAALREYETDDDA